MNLKTDTSSIKSNILYQGSKKIGSNSYLIEIKREDGFLRIELDNPDKNDKKYLIEFKEKEGNKILFDAKYNYNEIVERIKIDDKSRKISFKTPELLEEKSNPKS